MEFEGRYIWFNKINDYIHTSKSHILIINTIFFFLLYNLPNFIALISFVLHFIICNWWPDLFFVLFCCVYLFFVRKEKIGFRAYRRAMIGIPRVILSFSNIPILRPCVEVSKNLYWMPLQRPVGRVKKEKKKKTGNKKIPKNIASVGNWIHSQYFFFFKHFFLNYLHVEIEGNRWYMKSSC